MQKQKGISIKNAFNNYFYIGFLNEMGPCAFRQRGNMVLQCASIGVQNKQQQCRGCWPKINKKKKKFSKTKDVKTEAVI